MADTPPAQPHDPQQPEPAVAEVYLGNILYALERCAMALDAEDKPLDAAFYRGIGRKLSHERAETRRRLEQPGTGNDDR